jgi:hypothetical protein
MLRLLKQPSALLPLIISAGFLSAFAIGIAQGTLVRRPDEGAGAHLFQILMPLQILIMAVFAWSWLPRERSAATQVLALQVAAAVSVVAVVYFRHL